MKSEWNGMDFLTCKDLLIADPQPTVTGEPNAGMNGIGGT